MTTWVDIVEGISADTWTPLGETTEVVARYFMDLQPKRSHHRPLPAKLCIVVTDGLPTMDRHPAFIATRRRRPGTGQLRQHRRSLFESNDCSDYFDDATYFMAHE
jgi:hypothetical protein